MKFHIHCLLSILSLLSLTACASSLSPNVYTTSGAGQLHRVMKGMVTSSRIVKVTEDGDLGVGGVAGGALGAIAGSEIGGGSGSLAGGIGGALLGGFAGHQIQNSLSTQTGIEYVVKLRNNSLISVVQAPTPTFNRGQHVLVQYGARGRARIIADPDYYTYFDHS